MLRPALPNVPGAGKANAAVLNHCVVVGFESSGLPTRFGRSFAPKPRIDRPVPLLSISDNNATVNGRPDWRVTIPEVCQPVKTPFKTSDSQPLLLPKYCRPSTSGNAYEKLTDNRWRTSKFER